MGPRLCFQNLLLGIVVTPGSRMAPENMNTLYIFFSNPYLFLKTLLLGGAASWPYLEQCGKFSAPLLPVRWLVPTSDLPSGSRIQLVSCISAPENSSCAPARHPALGAPQIRGVARRGGIGASATRLGAERAPYHQQVAVYLRRLQSSRPET